MSRKQKNAGFTCEQCGQDVTPVSNGSYRNHCPFCLFSKHLDILPGDRESTCQGLMEPVNIKFRSGKGYQIIHRCLKCGMRSVNRIAENTVQPDNMDLITRLSAIHPRYRRSDTTGEEYRGG